MKKNDLEIFWIVESNNKQQYFEWISIGSDINIINEYGENLLHVSARVHADHDIAIDLLKRNINVNQQNIDGDTALHYYTEPYGKDYRYEIIKAIVQKGANLNLQDKHGNSPLWVAVFNSKGIYIEVVKLIMQYGGNPYTKNIYGKTPIDIALQWKADMNSIEDKSIENQINKLIQLLDIENRFRLSSTSMDSE